jgi:hypothetical protein
MPRHAHESMIRGSENAVFFPLGLLANCPTTNLMTQLILGKNQGRCTMRTLRASGRHF